MSKHSYYREHLSKYTDKDKCSFGYFMKKYNNRLKNKWDGKGFFMSFALNQYKNRSRLGYSMN